MNYNLRPLYPIIVQFAILLFFIPTAHSQTTKSFIIASPTQAILFVTNESDKSTDFIMRLHEKYAQEILKQVPVSTTNLLVTKTNAKILTFIVGNQRWTIDISTLKQRHAMILFDGAAKPKIIYDNKAYLATAKTILPHNLKIAAQRSSSSYSAKQFFDSIAQIQFIPSLRYVEAIIEKSALPIYYNQGKRKCDGTYVTELLSGQDSVTPSSITTTVYEQGKELTSNNLSGGNNYYSKRFYNNHALIDSIQYLQNSQWSNSTIYRYLPHAIISHDPALQSATIYHLNDKFQVEKKESIHFLYHRTDWTTYRYDDYNRIVQEISGRNEQTESRSTYAYDSLDKSVYSSRKTFDQTGQLKAEAKRSDQGNETIEEFYSEGLLQQKSVVKDLGNCTFENMIYGSQGQLISKSIQLRKSL
jgi:hypothetical protein